MFCEENDFMSPSEYKSEMEELDYLQFFYGECDFGPAHEDVIECINQAYRDDGKDIPEGYE